jgi:hypothetical protein
MKAASRRLKLPGESRLSPLRPSPLPAPPSWLPLRGIHAALGILPLVVVLRTQFSGQPVPASLRSGGPALCPAAPPPSQSRPTKSGERPDPLGRRAVVRQNKRTRRRADPFYQACTKRQLGRCAAKLAESATAEPTYAMMPMPSRKTSRRLA